MSAIGIGDLAQSFLNSRNVNSVKSRLYSLNAELNTGRIGDLSSHLGGQTTAVDALDRDLSILDSYGLANKRLALSFDRLQLSFDAIGALREGMAEQFAVITPASLDREFVAASTRAKEDMSTIITKLNARDGDRVLLSGTAVDQTPLASADEMLADVVAAIGTATDTTTIVDIVGNWFDAPGGGFDTIGYLGDTGAAATRKIGPDEVVTLEARADDPAIRSLLKGTTLAAIVELLPTTLSRNVESDLMRASSEELFTASAGLVGMQALIGENQERLSRAETAQSAQMAAYTVAKNELTLADPYETATKLQDIQRQLELQFASTARLSQLSLANYL